MEDSIIFRRISAKSERAVWLGCCGEKTDRPSKEADALACKCCLLLLICRDTRADLEYFFSYLTADLLFVFRMKEKFFRSGVEVTRIATVFLRKACGGMRKSTKFMLGYLSYGLCNKKL
jgi:hypothetical protein